MAECQATTGNTGAAARWRWLLAAVLSVILLGICLRTTVPVVGSGSTSGSVLPRQVLSHPIIRGAPAPIHATDAPRLPELANDPEAWQEAIARAYAALGRWRDGWVDQAPVLDAAAAACRDVAEAMLAKDRARKGQGRPSIPSKGILGPVVEISAPPGLAKAAGIDPTGDSGSVGDGNPEAVDRAKVQSDTSDRAGVQQPNPLQAMERRRDGIDLTKAGLWADSTFDPGYPAHRGGMRISNRSDGDYAVSLEADDFSTIRLDGGMVVPGRYYRVRGDAVITGAKPAHVTIRPLVNLPVYFEKPTTLPQTNG